MIANVIPVQANLKKYIFFNLLKIKNEKHISNERISLSHANNTHATSTRTTTIQLLLV